MTRARFRTGWMLSAAVAIAAASGRVHADELFLTQQGVIEGRVIEENPNVLRVQTATGVLDIPAVIVARRVRGPSRIERYEDLEAQQPLTAARHVEIARWCRENRLQSAADEHAAAALEIEPAHPDARRLAGFILVGDVWLKTHPLVEVEEPRRSDADACIVDQLVAGWHRRIRAIHDAFLSGTDSQSRNMAAGREQLMALRSPLAIPGSCRFLTTGSVSTRTLLAEFLGSFDQDVASLNLFAMALLDDDLDVRLAAASQLSRRGDPRACDLFRFALRCEVDEIVRRTAAALGRMHDRAAVGDLIEALPTNAFEGQRQTLKAIIDRAKSEYDASTRIPLSDSVYEYAPAILLPEFNRTVELFLSGAAPATGRHRSEVQEALIDITGQNFGFNAQAWRQWLARNPPLEVPQP